MSDVVLTEIEDCSSVKMDCRPWGEPGQSPSNERRREPCRPTAMSSSSKLSDDEIGEVTLA